MPPQPKRKYAKSRQGQRRNHIAAVTPAIMICPQCKSAMQPHHACPSCGQYNGRDTTEKKSSPSKTS
ncbi:MAG: 50S ribosomal protein L32 [Dehalococcoidales bacterium]|nr:50S ribosomal protein L32 [Dehalococcoidales bacterium]